MKQFEKEIDQLIENIIDIWQGEYDKAFIYCECCPFYHMPGRCENEEIKDYLLQEIEQ